MYSSIPKVLHKLAGMPMISHVVNAAKRLDPNRICVVYGHGGEAVPAALGSDELSFALQEPQLGTGHAVQTAIPHLEGTGSALILYGDVPLIKTSTLEKMLGKPDCLTLLTVELENPKGYGRILRDDMGKIERIVEEKDAAPGEKAIREVNTGIMAAPVEMLKSWVAQLRNDNAQQEYYLTDIVEMAVRDGIPVQSVQPDDVREVRGVNDRSQLAELERAFQSERARELMKKGVGLADPARIDIRGSLDCGMDVYIDINCLFEGEVKLGNKVRIGAHSVLRNAEIQDGTEVAPFSHIEGAVIAKNCRIGPYARIRPGTVLGEEAHVGNFVEIKNSRVGNKSKANHLSYIGDADVGKNVNIGAGTITCNYDGANKHMTLIEDDAFIGSDTQLVAPVTVGKGATIGAGSTITRNTPQGGLTLSRSKQVHVEHWKRPVKKG